jgi:predicted transcriptional regulator
MEIERLFSEFSSKTRLDILGMLREGETRFSEIEKAVGLSSPEVSRHLRRLQEVNLIDKQPSGGYRLSLFGETVMRMTANIPALIDKSEYFLSHDTSVIPTHLLRSLDSISEAKLEPVFSMFGRLIKNLEDAEYYWDITNQMLESETEMLEMMAPEDLDIDIRYIISPELYPTFSRLSEERGVRIHLKTYEDINFTVGVSSNLAFLALPDRNGVLDRNTYIMGDSPEFIGWCRKLYLYYWDMTSLI